MKQIIQADKDNYKNVLNQIRFEWVYSILSQTGMDIDDCFPASGSFEDQTIKNKQDLRKKLNDNNILIIDNVDDSIIIYIQNEIIAEWKKPLFIRREDISEKDPKKKFYIEINVEFNSVFDEEMSSE